MTIIIIEINIIIILLIYSYTDIFNIDLVNSHITSNLLVSLMLK